MFVFLGLNVSGGEEGLTKCRVGWCVFVCFSQKFQNDPPTIPHKTAYKNISTINENKQTTKNK